MKHAILILTILLLPGIAYAQEISGGLATSGLDAVQDGIGRNAITLLAAITALSLAPGIAIMVTCFPFIVTVLSILRQSIGLQQSPPNMLIVSLAMFLTWFVMSPVLTEAWNTAGAPLRDGTITIEQAFERAIVPFRGFMEARTDPEMLASLAEVSPSRMPRRSACRFWFQPSCSAKFSVRSRSGSWWPCRFSSSTLLSRPC